MLNDCVFDGNIEVDRRSKKIVRKFGVSKLMNVSKKLNRLKLSELIRLLKCDEISTR